MRTNRRTRASVFGPLISVLAVILGLVLVGPISPAIATAGGVEGGCSGYDNTGGESGSASGDWGSLTWSGSEVQYVVNEGYTLDLCVKAASENACNVPAEWEQTFSLEGEASGTKQTCENNKNGGHAGISHVAWSTSGETPQETPKDADATVDITPATCDTGETASEGGTTHASWVAADDVTGPATYSFTANADTDHQFGDGSSQKVYSDDLAGPDESLCEQTIPTDASATVDITPATCDTGEIASEGDTTHASWVAADDETGPGSYSFTANADSDHLFGDGSDQKVFSDDLAGPDTSLCEDDGHNPPGNNGSIKVDDDGEPGCNVGHGNGICDNGVGDDPHLGCQFYVEWYNYGANATSSVTFEVQDPTEGTVTAVQGTVAPGTVQLDGDDASGANDAGFDGSELYQLSFSDPGQKNHGWHVKVTTVTTDSLGNSETKYKVFWVEGDCNPIPVTPSVTMVDNCGTANDSGPTYDADTDYWTAEQGEGNTIVFSAKEGYFFPAGDNTSEDGKTYTVTYTPNTDVPCEQTQDASAAVVLDTAQTCQTGQSAAPGDITGATWNEGATTVFGPGSYNFVATAMEGYLFPADADGVSEDRTTQTFSGTLLGPDTSLCTPRKPNPVPVSETVQGCDLSAFGLEPGTGHRDGTRDWELVDGQWELLPLSDAVWGPYVQDTTLTDDEYQAQCAGPQPEPLQRVVHQQEEGCTVGGVHTWDDVYTTPYVWDADTQTWVLGDEEGPVVENEVFTGYTTQEQEDLGCIEVEGEQGHKPPKHHPNHNTPEVKGEQATVPNQVEAGLLGTPAEHAPAGGSNLPLWLLSLGAGMFLTGAGRLRRRGGAHR